MIFNAKQFLPLRSRFANNLRLPSGYRPGVPPVLTTGEGALNGVAVGVATADGFGLGIGDDVREGVTVGVGDAIGVAVGEGLGSLLAHSLIFGYNNTPPTATTRRTMKSTPNSPATHGHLDDDFAGAGWTGRTGDTRVFELDGASMSRPWVASTSNIDINAVPSCKQKFNEPSE